MARGVGPDQLPAEHSISCSANNTITRLGRKAELEKNQGKITGIYAVCCLLLCYLSSYYLPATYQLPTSSFPPASYYPSSLFMLGCGRQGGGSKTHILASNSCQADWLGNSSFGRLFGPEGGSANYTIKGEKLEAAVLWWCYLIKLCTIFLDFFRNMTNKKYSFINKSPEEFFPTILYTSSPSPPLPEPTSLREMNNSVCI